LTRFVVFDMERMKKSLYFVIELICSVAFNHIFKQKENGSLTRNVQIIWMATSLHNHW